MHSGLYKIQFLCMQILLLLHVFTVTCGMLGTSPDRLKTSAFCQDKIWHFDSTLKNKKESSRGPAININCRELETMKSLESLLPTAPETEII